MKFIMVEKGYEYKTEDGRYTIKKSWERVRVNPEKYASSLLAPRKTISKWTVYPEGQPIIRQFHKLADAKAWIQEAEK